jgi:hypothetical protein
MNPVRQTIEVKESMWMKAAVPKMVVELHSTGGRQQKSIQVTAQDSQ